MYLKKDVQKFLFLVLFILFIYFFHLHLSVRPTLRLLTYLFIYLFIYLFTLFYSPSQSMIYSFQGELAIDRNSNVVSPTELKRLGNFQ